MLVREQFAIGHDPLSCYRERLGVASYAITDRTRNSTLVLSPRAVLPPWRRIVRA